VDGLRLLELIVFGVLCHQGKLEAVSDLTRQHLQVATFKAVPFLPQFGEKKVVGAPFVRGLEEGCEVQVELRSGRGQVDSQLLHCEYLCLDKEVKQSDVSRIVAEDMILEQAFCASSHQIAQSP
jgi:hypothetical protein